MCGIGQHTVKKQFERFQFQCQMSKHYVPHIVLRISLEILNIDVTVLIAFVQKLLSRYDPECVIFNHFINKNIYFQKFQIFMGKKGEEFFSNFYMKIKLYLIL